MTILLTNDDGIEARGIQVLAELFSPHHDVWVVAPATQQSGRSHGITIFETVTLAKQKSKQYACSGTPADCVLYAMGGSLGLRPDLVISGINEGYNLGSDVIYSGTLGAAREGHLRGVPAIALSSGDRAPEAYRCLATFVLNNLTTLMGYTNENFLLNINYPRVANNHMVARFAKLGIQYYEDVITTETLEIEGKEVIAHRLSGTGNPQSKQHDTNTDIYVTAHGDIAMSLIAAEFKSHADILAAEPLAL